MLLFGFENVGGHILNFQYLFTWEKYLQINVCSLAKRSTCLSHATTATTTTRTQLHFGPQGPEKGGGKEEKSPKQQQQQHRKGLKNIYTPSSQPLQSRLGHQSQKPNFTFVAPGAREGRKEQAGNEQRDRQKIPFSSSWPAVGTYTYQITLSIISFPQISFSPFCRLLLVAAVYKEMGDDGSSSARSVM